MGWVEDQERMGRERQLGEAGWNIPTISGQAGFSEYQRSVEQSSASWTSPEPTATFTPYTASPAGEYSTGNYSRREYSRGGYFRGGGFSLGIRVLQFAGIVLLGLFVLGASQAVAEKTGHWIWGAMTFGAIVGSLTGGWIFFRTKLGELVGSILLWTALLGGIAWGAWVGATGKFLAPVTLISVLVGTGALVTLLHRAFYWPVGSEEVVQRAEQRAKLADRIARIVIKAAVGLGVLAALLYGLK